MSLALLFLLGCVSDGSTAVVNGDSGRVPSSTVVDASGYSYQSGDRSCDGYPRLNVGTAPGTCLGLVLPRNGSNLIMPRTIVQARGTPDFFLIDMGGWKANNGALYLMKSRGGAFELIKLKGGLHMPHGLDYGQDDWIYVGESHQIWRFKWNKGQMSAPQMVYNKLVRGKGYMHPLTQFAFHPVNGDIYINYGSPTDHCFASDDGGGYRSCPEGDQDGHGSLLRIPGSLLKNIPKDGVVVTEVTANGLRNSMALAVHPTGTVVQGENARDFPELEEPYEELNVLNPEQSAVHFGWPYCYDFHALSPEWLYPENKNNPMRREYKKAVDCNNRVAKGPGQYQPPWILLPPHSAPLNLSYYNGSMFPEWQGRLLVSLHGYQPSGHRMLSFPVDAKGRPMAKEGVKSQPYGFNQKGRCAVTREYSPRGGLVRSAPYEEIIHAWDQVKGVRPKGAPVGFTVADDGSIFIVEDRENRTVVRLARTNAGPISVSCGEDAGSNFSDPRIELLAWRRAANRNQALRDGLAATQANVVTKYCASCHGGFKETDIAQDKYMLLDFLVKNEWITPGQSKHSKIVQAIAQTGEFPAMPPAGSPPIVGNRDAEKAVAAMKVWIDGMPKDVNSSFQKIEIGSARKIRSIPGNAGKECGRFEAGDTVYVNPDDRVAKDGWLWSEVYIVPEDSRLFYKACPSPSDGVYWMALVKQR
ncbi:MAG: PQQ-dependent sugar dehydrogenase [Bdellovibrionales bacterium]|nr:PQQ-dependent sugar dehydrogenase [Bdellovibrionales bacterium]